MESILLVTVFSKDCCCMKWHHKANSFISPAYLQQQCTDTAVLFEHMRHIGVSLVASTNHIETATAFGRVLLPGHKLLDEISINM